MSPLHLFERQQDFAYQQEVAGSPSKRHHVRFWRCPTTGCCPGVVVDWLAAGTYDRSVGLSLFTLQITHKIEEDTDVERDFIVTTVVDADPAVEVEVIKNFSTGYHSRNGGGDLIETDGHLPILDVAERPRPPRVSGRGRATDSRDRRPAPTVFGSAVTFLAGSDLPGIRGRRCSTHRMCSPTVRAQGPALAAIGRRCNRRVDHRVVLIAAAMIDCGLGAGGPGGSQLGAAGLMSACVFSTTLAMVANYRGTDAITLAHLPTVGFSILVLLALSSPRARDYASAAASVSVWQRAVGGLSEQSLHHRRREHRPEARAVEPAGSRAASASSAACRREPTSSSSWTATSPSGPGSSRRRSGRPTRPSDRRCRCCRRSPCLCGPRYQSRSNQPIVVGSSPGSSAAYGSTGVDLVEVVGMQVAGLAVDVDLDRADPSQRGPDDRERRAEPPLDVGQRARPEGDQPAGDQVVDRVVGARARSGSSPSQSEVTHERRPRHRPVGPVGAAQHVPRMPTGSSSPAARPTACRRRTCAAHRSR